MTQLDRLLKGTDVYFVKSPSEIPVYPLGDLPSECRILDMTLKEYVQDIFGKRWSSVRCVSSVEEIIPKKASLILFDDLFISAKLLVLFLKAAKIAQNHSRLVIPKHPFGTHFFPLDKPYSDQGRIPLSPQNKKSFEVKKTTSEITSEVISFPVFYLKDDCKDPDKSIVELIIKPKGKVQELDAIDSKISVPLTAEVVLLIDSWAAVLKANQLALMAYALSTSPIIFFLRLLWAVITRFSFNKWKIGKGFNEKGRGCDIHPDATVEFSRLGKNVRVCAGAVVRGSWIGDNVTIEENSVTYFSVVGKNSIIQRLAMCSFCVLYPRAKHAGTMQLGLFGCDSVTKADAIGADMTLKGKIFVRTTDGLYPVREPYMGVCLGHRTFIGSGVYIGAGRAVPNDVGVVVSQNRILRKIPEEVGEGMYYLEDGTLFPI